MTKKFDAFRVALEALCREHGVELASTGWEHIVVSDLREGDSPIYMDYLEDGTTD